MIRIAIIFTIIFQAQAICQSYTYQPNPNLAKFEGKWRAVTSNDTFVIVIRKVTYHNPTLDADQDLLMGAHYYGKTGGIRENTLSDTGLLQPTAAKLWTSVFGWDGRGDSSEIILFVKNISKGSSAKFRGTLVAPNRIDGEFEPRMDVQINGKGEINFTTLPITFIKE